MKGCERSWIPYRLVSRRPPPKFVTISYYLAHLDPEPCINCGLCRERCQVEAIRERDGLSEILAKKCIGCGLCVGTCPEEAISLLEKPGMAVPPLDLNETLKKIGAERMALQNRS